MTDGSISSRMGNQPLPAVAIQEAARVRKEVPIDETATPGKGELQGFMVAVGTGESRDALLRDAIGAQDGASVSRGSEAPDDDIFHDRHEIDDEQFLRLRPLLAQPPAGMAVRPGMPPDTLLLEDFLEDGQEEPLVRTGATEDRHQAGAAIERQDGTVLKTIGGLFAAVLRPAGILADVIDFERKRVEAHMVRWETAVMDRVVAFAQRAAGPKEEPKTVPKTAREENLARIQVLCVEIERKQQELNSQIKKKTGEDTIATAGRPAPAASGFASSLFSFRHTVSGAASATTAALPAVSMAAAAPVVAGAVAPMFGAISGYLLQVAAFLCSAYMVMTDWLSHANDKAVLGMIESGLKDIEPLQKELASRLAEERSRQAADTRLRVAAVPRSQEIGALRAQLADVEKARGINTPGVTTPGVTATDGAGPEEAAPRELPRVTLGDGTLRRQLQDESLGMRMSFFLFFSRLIDFLFVRRSAANEERAYVRSVGRSFNALATPLPSSNLDLLEAAAEKRRERLGQAKMAPRDLRRQLLQGENLAHALRSASGPSFGAVAFDGGPLHGKHAIAATLTTARILAQYLDALADLAPEDRAKDEKAPEVLRHPDGSLSVADPGRKLHSFLMSAPTAYSPWVRASEAVALSSVLVIDDHSPGMPGGMHGMRFETGLDEAGNGETLHLSFVAKSVGQVFKPLGKDMDTLFRLRDVVSNPVVGARTPPPELAQMSPDALRDLHAQLAQRLVQLITLREADIAQSRALEHWRNPHFEAERTRN